MTWVITRLCIDCVDQRFVDVCPVDCIYEYDGEDRKTFPIVFAEDTGLNAKILEIKEEFSVPEVEEKPKPTPEEIEKNKEKWGYRG